MQPRMVAALPGNDGEHLLIVGTTLYTTNPYRMSLIDISNPNRPQQIAVHGWVSENGCHGVLATPHHLITVMDNGIYAYPLHAAR
jgi:hypothetical protein